ncbi:MAG: hypothetical protein DMG89_19260 [Acidobacteria bacterium]|nr:MAG: hypothetical protein DMG89_19260 [Acidobacteriota bacterium]
MKIYRIVRLVILAGLLIAIFLLLKRPAPVSLPQDRQTVAANVQSYEQKLNQLEQAQAQGQTQSEIRLTAGEISAAMSQGGSIPAPAVETPAAKDKNASEAPPKVTDYQVSFENDVARGQFTTELAGKQVYVTIAGHLGAKDGYATFEPTEFKVGDLSIPVAMVNERLQQRLQEEHDRLKLPDFVGGLKIENGELVVTPQAGVQRP